MALKIYGTLMYNHRGNRITGKNLIIKARHNSIKQSLSHVEVLYSKIGWNYTQTRNENKFYCASAVLKEATSFPYNTTGS
jgi:hypothetical protein